MNKKKRQALILSLFLAVSLATTIAVNSMVAGLRVSHQLAKEAIAPTLFGLHLHHVVTLPNYSTNPPLTELTPWPPVPFSSWRMWDAYVGWPNLERRKGEWNFEILDDSLALAEENQVEVLLVLGLSPRWASARPSESSKYGPGNAAEPKEIEDWRNYVRTVAERYKGRIHYYEMWNEPNLPGFYSGTLDQMLTLSKEAYQILKQVDPSITVVSPSAAHNSGKGLPWIEEYLKKGGGAYADVIGYHLYVKPEPPEAMMPVINTLRQYMRDYGVSDKPLWNTEAGWQKPKPFPSDELAAAYVARSYILNWAGGVSRFYWYNWDYNPTMSLHMTQEDSTTLKPAAISYQEVQKWLVGARMQQCQANSHNTWICQLTREGDYRAWILWNPEVELRFQVPTDWNVDQIRDLAGEKRTLSNNTIQVGPSPLLLEHFQS